MGEGVFVNGETGGDDVSSGNGHIHNLTAVSQSSHQHFRFKPKIVSNSDNILDKLASVLSIRLLPADKRRHIKRAGAHRLQCLCCRKDQRHIGAYASFFQQPHCLECTFHTLQLNDKVGAHGRQLLRFSYHFVGIQNVGVYFYRDGLVRPFHHCANFIDYFEEWLAGNLHVPGIGGYAVNVPGVKRIFDFINDGAVQEKFHFNAPCLVCFWSGGR